MPHACAKSKDTRVRRHMMIPEVLDRAQADLSSTPMYLNRCSCTWQVTQVHSHVSIYMSGMAPWDTWPVDLLLPCTLIAHASFIVQHNDEFAIQVMTKHYRAAMKSVN